MQTGAFRDPAEAAKHVRSLEGLGLNAYTEAVTVGQDLYLRVRAGCFLDKEGADAVTLLLRQRPGEEAAVTAPLSSDAPARLCAAYELGFRPPKIGRSCRARETGFSFGWRAGPTGVSSRLTGRRARLAGAGGCSRRASGRVGKRALSRHPKICAAKLLR